MSSILKALKKLEHEKSVRKPHSFRIDADILRGGSTRKPFSTGATLAAITLFLCGAGATYMYMKYNKTPAPFQFQHSQASINEVKSEPSTDATQLSVSNITATVTKPRTSLKVISVTETLKSSSRALEKNQAQRVKSAEMVPQAVTSEPKPVSLFVPVDLVAPPLAKPVLKVNGIAFQDGADSVAVINGITVSKGSVIEGARVEEIQKDHVRLSRGGEKLYLILEKSD
jgi:general secretion pathway protein B